MVPLVQPWSVAISGTFTRVTPSDGHPRHGAADVSTSYEADGRHIAGQPRPGFRHSERCGVAG